MNAVIKAVVETVVVLATGTAVALAVNAGRGGNGLKLDRNYFPAAIAPTADTSQAAPAATQAEPAKSPDTTTPAVPVEPAAEQPAAVKQAKPAHPPHEFQEINLDALAAIVQGTSEFGLDYAGRVIFVDARNDQAFGEGHLPGAIQLDNYKIEQYIEPVLAAAELAEMIVVYCNGGECEDSILACRYLVRDYGVRMDKIRLYAGGWKEWFTNEMPYE